MVKKTGKKKKTTTIRPWCWYCERDFEDEKVLMQHQKAKHFKCNHCPRRLNTAGGLAVHIQQVHKLEPEPIENALPGRDGYDVEIFGMEGIPAPDLADYKRRKETELGLAPGSTSMPPSAKRPKFDKRPLTQAELALQLAAHKALMSGGELPTLGAGAMPTEGPTIGAPVAYGAPPQPFPIPMPGMVPPLGFPPVPPGVLLPGGQPPPFSTGIPGMPPPGFPGMMPPPFPGGAPPPGGVPGMPMMPPLGQLPPSMVPLPHPSQIAPVEPAPPAQNVATGPPAFHPPQEAPGPTFAPVQKPEYARQPELKDGSKLVWADAEMSPEERRAKNPKYTAPYANAASEQTNGSSAEAPRGMKRARAEDFL